MVGAALAEGPGAIEGAAFAAGWGDMEGAALAEGPGAIEGAAFAAGWGDMEGGVFVVGISFRFYNPKVEGYPKRAGR